MSFSLFGLHLTSTNRLCDAHFVNTGTISSKHSFSSVMRSRREDRTQPISENFHSILFVVPFLEKAGHREIYFLLLLQPLIKFGSRGSTHSAC